MSNGRPPSPGAPSSITRAIMYIFLFERYKSRRHPHPSRHASWVFLSPPRVSCLTLEHPSTPCPHSILTHYIQLGQSTLSFCYPLLFSTVVETASDSQPARPKNDWRQ